MRTKFHLAQLVAIFPLLCFGVAEVSAESGNVTAHVELSKSRAQPGKGAGDSGNVVMWLSPLTGTPQPAATKVTHFRLVQKDKQFTPHLLVVPVGSSVEFPNLDPFYHNVFSLFNGKRFDLGLYEAGSTRTVHFDLAGVSYIFCNIHPEMGAVIISLATPYSGVSASNGSVALHDVPDGTYQLNIWAEGTSPARLQSLRREVTIGPQSRDLGVIRVIQDLNPEKHKNKFGEDYFPTVPSY